VNLLNDKRHPATYFLDERESIVRGLLNLRRQVCGYGAIGPCDCKYGVREKAHPASEQSGCPEVLAAATILSVMTDDEYLEFAKRAGCFHT
jgi:hypothetical protein